MERFEGLAEIQRDADSLAPIQINGSIALGAQCNKLLLSSS
ncbi:MAG: hypothetical protein AAFZ15_02225 [Bacteroidota bacterium]